MTPPTMMSQNNKSGLMGLPQKQQREDGRRDRNDPPKGLRSGDHEDAETRSEEDGEGQEDAANHRQVPLKHHTK